MPLSFSHALHECRTANLGQIDARGKVMVSIGAADLWYFKWIDENCGMPERHIGVEYYMPKPENLPGNVEWIVNTAGHMPGVGSGVADILFSGQNIEHLWQDEVAGFLAEAHRVLKPGGLFVADSPNRAITEVYGGAHPEHMVELTPEEAVELFTAAGFDVVSAKGVFLCRDLRTGEILSIETLTDAAPNSTIVRCVNASDHPDASYVWWIQAGRAEREFDASAVKAVIERYWARGWPERLNRLVSNIGKTRTADDGRRFWESDAGEGGALAYGPYAPLKAGRYRATLFVRPLTSPPGPVLGHVDVVVTSEAVVKASRDLTSQDLTVDTWTPVSLEFTLDEMIFGFQIRLFSNGEVALSVERRIELVVMD